MNEAFGCKRCGYCCIYLTVVIPRLTDSWDPRKLGYYHKPNDVICPNLRFEETQAHCAIHGEPYFQESPCDRHNNPDHDPDIWHWGSTWRCIGPALMAQGLQERRPPAPATFADLEYLGD